MNDDTNQPRWGLAILTVVAVLGAGIIFGGLAKGTARKVMQSEPITKEQVADLARNVAYGVNAKLPQDVGNAVLTEVKSGGNVIRYRYELKRTARAYDAANLRREYQMNMRQQFCAIDDFRELLSFGISFKFNYFSSDGEYVITHELNSNDC